MKNSVKVVVASNRDCNVDLAVTVNYTCQYEYKGMVRMIDEFGTYREIKGNDVGRTTTDGVKTGYFPSILQFSKTVMYHEYTYNDNENDADFDKTRDKNTKDVVEKFYGKCPLFLVNGKSHTVGQSGNHFDVIDSNIKTMTAVHSFKDKLRAAVKLNDMSHAERCDVAFYYGLSPIGKSEEEVLVELGDAEAGYCLADNHLAGFLKVWVDGKSDDRDLLVTLKKAVGLEIIDNKITDGRNAYYLGETFLGSDEAGLIDWSRKNPREFAEHIVRKVTESEKKEEKTVKSIAVNNASKPDMGILESLKKQAKELVEEGFIASEANSDKMGYEKLKKCVDAALLKKNSVTV